MFMWKFYKHAWVRHTSAMAIPFPRCTPKKNMRIAGWLTVFMSAPRKTKHLFPHPCPELRTIWESGHNGFVPTQQPRHEMEPRTLCMIWAGLHAWFGPDGNQTRNTSCKLLLPTKWIRAARSQECQTPHPGMVWDATTLVPGQNITMLLTIIP